MPKLGRILKGQQNMGGRGAVSSSGRGIGSASSFLDEKHMSMVFMNGTRAEFS